MKGIILVIVLLLTNSLAFSCLCNGDKIDLVREQSIKDSEFIFIARITKDGPRKTFLIEILKSFKGDLTGTIKYELDEIHNSDSDCEFMPNLDDGDQYLVYANRQQSLRDIQIKKCSGTRSITHPENHFSYWMNAPVHLKPPDTRKKNEYLRKEKRQARQDLKFEIEELEKLFGR